MSATLIVSVTDALMAAGQILSLVQNAQAAGKGEISRADFDAAVSARDTALAQLDADIAVQTHAGAAVPVHE